MDIDNLVKRLRVCEKFDPDQKDAADLIEAQATQIEELEKQNECFMEQLSLRSESAMHKDMQEIMRINNQLVARITELESALEKFIHYDEAKDDDGVMMMLNYNDAIEAARAVMKRGNVMVIKEPLKQVDYMSDDTRIAKLEAALKNARDLALEEAAIEIERVGHKEYPNKLISDGYAYTVRSLKSNLVMENKK
jgi:hypothetical protein